MSTGRPVSTPVDHARWEEERKRLEAASTDAGGTVVKIADPILDNRWAMVFGGTLWLILIGLGGFLYGKLDTVSTKQDATNDKLTSMSIQMGQQNAGQQVLGIRFDALEDKVDRSLKNQDARIERLERGR